MPNRIPKAASRWISRHPSVVLTYIAVVCSITAIVVATGARNKSNDLRDSQRESCVKVGEPLRTAVIGLLQDQIQQSKAADLELFFPNIDPETLRTAVARANTLRRARLKPLLAVESCVARFP